VSIFIRLIGNHSTQSQSAGLKLGAHFKRKTKTLRLVKSLLFHWISRVLASLKSGPWLHASLMSPRSANFFARKQRTPHRHGWYPSALQRWNLVSTIAFCWTLITVLQYFLHKSQFEGDFIFAPGVNDLLLRQSFVYLYLPTIFAVIFSILIVWVDNDARRFKPYLQMSRAGGVSGKELLLLHYPFDFVLFVPFAACRRGLVSGKKDIRAATNFSKTLTGPLELLSHSFDGIRRRATASRYLLN
jgi:hypothetical protein